LYIEGEGFTGVEALEAAAFADVLRVCDVDKLVHFADFAGAPWAAVAWKCPCLFHPPTRSMLGFYACVLPLLLGAVRLADSAGVAARA
jgi:hypothetical protein